MSRSNKKPVREDFTSEAEYEELRQVLVEDK